MSFERRGQFLDIVLMYVLGKQRFARWHLQSVLCGLLKAVKSKSPSMMLTNISDHLPQKSSQGDLDGRSYNGLRLHTPQEISGYSGRVP